MTLTAKQQLVISILNEQGQATKKEIVDACIREGLGNYINTGKYVGETLSRMVRSNLIKRVKKGVYELAPSNKMNTDPNQLSLI